MARILLTAFEPFGGDAVNPSLEILRALANRPDVDALTVPVTFGGAAETVLSHLPGHDAVVLMGLAKGRKEITVERVAINIDDASIPDNAGDRPVDRPICAEGAPAYFATLPIRQIVEAIRAAGVPASISNSAGTYVCNHLMYSVLHALREMPVAAGFLHVPATPELVQDTPGTPSLPLQDMVRGIGAALDIL